MANQLILMQGVPGSGKSTVAKMLVHGHKEWGTPYEIISTDDYWDRGGVYAFEAGLLDQAHRWNQQRAVVAMAKNTPLVIIDNTNITKKAAVPYVVLANMYEYDVTVVRVDPGLDVALSRNEERPEDRRVPPDVIHRMYDNMETLLPLP